MIEWLTSMYSVSDDLFRLFGIDIKTRQWCLLTVVPNFSNGLQISGKEVYENVQRFDTDRAVMYFERVKYMTESETLYDFCDYILNILEEMEG